jgi:hypothetical protein
MSTPIRLLESKAKEPIGQDSSETPSDFFRRTFQQQLHDAVQLLGFGVADGRDIPSPVVGAIVAAAQNTASGAPTDYAAFLTAYDQLAHALAPTTAITLRATSDAYGRRSILAPRAVSEAKLWSRKLWLWTLFFCLAIVVRENAQQTVGTNTQAAMLLGPLWGSVCCTALTSLAPFAYGALGACAYLLRVCHRCLHDRTFDPIHTPEYQGRILLGAVSGGTVLLLAQYLSGEATKTPLSGAALAFLAGYRNDLLFDLIGRLVTTLIPKGSNGGEQKSHSAA